ncbi:MAG TPA: LysR family transcriptional regulator [Lactobacillus sp.]|nr:LysR family transcriptional regulator [Lactobacillus sp.]
MSHHGSINMLRFLDVLLKHGNFTRAAKDLYISQPYLTQYIKATEKDLGIQIINRKATPLELTAAGRLYYQYLTTLENQKDKFHKEISQYTTPDHQVIRIGVLASLGYYLLPLVLPDFLQVHPEVSIELTEDISEHNEQRLLHNEIDFLVGQNPETIAPGLEIYDRGQDSYYSIIPRSSSLYQSDKDFLNPGTVDIDQLLHEPLILSPRGSSIRRQVDYLLQKYDVKPHIIVESANIFTVTKLVEKGLGVTFMPNTVTTQPNGSQYNLYPLPPSLISLNYFIAHRAGRSLSQNEHDLVTIFLTNLEASLQTPLSES